jgi:hypothetical protein
MIAGILGQLLRWLDKPWKAVVFTVLVLVGGIGYLVWVEAPFLTALFTPTPPSLRTMVSLQLDDLIIQTNADFVSLWAIEWGAANTQHMVLGRRRGGQTWELRPERIPAILLSTGNKLTQTILTGWYVCEAPIGASLLIQRMAADGMTWVCIIPVIPVPRQVIGLLYIAWRERPDKAHEDAFMAYAYHTASQLIDRGK